MIRARIYGSDTEFMAWLRSQEDELPSYSTEIGIVASDADAHIHRYLTAVDGKGTREIQALMNLEVKRGGDKLTTSQRDTFIKHHLCALHRRPINYCGQKIYHFGVSFLYCSNRNPADSEKIFWGRFDVNRLGEQRIVRTRITKDQLFKLLRFELDPDNLKERLFRRHHKERRFTEIVTTPLGFSIEQEIVLRS